MAKQYHDVTITEQMVGHKLGEFSAVCSFPECQARECVAPSLTDNPYPEPGSLSSGARNNITSGGSVYNGRLL